jgi:hypothetical protein
MANYKVLIDVPVPNDTKAGYFTASFDADRVSLVPTELKGLRINNLHIREISYSLIA